MTRIVRDRRKSRPLSSMMYDTHMLPANSAQCSSGVVPGMTSEPDGKPPKAISRFFNSSI